ncbi:DUF3472 domain-containing protein [Magnetospirillum moscoviense]|uniref:Uncharacterized protein n=1 Tax=Magnetospirillum moscoviense TaxID=1437059 RepID=A0A178ML24_9PROT|nr:hypothetical protein [Magnetospirillum moscoviense]MBF0326609.1 hypothetical protein [Alphaproteobacteria bacterium]OAN48818.1 hypothetical protein A6A05_14400 [Magnetospirillum moscoviense]
MLGALRHLVFVVLAALLVAAGPAGAQEWKRLPWHLVDYFYRMPDIADFRTLSMEVEIQGRVEPGQYVYVAPLNGKIGGNMFYFGLQTDLYNGDTRKMMGKGFIFSRWGAAEAGDGKPGPGGWAEAMTHTQSGEGDFASVRLPYAWQPGRYTFRMEARPATPLPGQWVDLSVTDHARARRVEIGSLRFPTNAPARFDPMPASFVEIYGKLPKDPARPGLLVAPDFTVRFAPPLVNGGLSPLGGDVHQSSRVPPFARLTRAADHGAMVVVGGTAAAPPERAP